MVKHLFLGTCLVSSSFSFILLRNLHAGRLWCRITFQRVSIRHHFVSDELIEDGVQGVGVVLLQLLQTVLSDDLFKYFFVNVFQDFTIVWLLAWRQHSGRPRRDKGHLWTHQPVDGHSALFEDTAAVGQAFPVFDVLIDRFWIFKGVF